MLETWVAASFTYLHSIGPVPFSASTVSPRGNEQQKRYFELLKKAYIDARYKRDFVITREEREYLAARVRKLQELAKRICEERIGAMG
jgi:Trp operon repressor